PGRAEPAERRSWLPVPDVNALPALEELLDNDRLVRSGQTQAITDTDPTPVEAPEERWAEFRARVSKPGGRRPARLRRRRKPAANPAPNLAPRPAREQPTKPARPQPRYLRRRVVIVGLALIAAAVLAVAVPQLLPHTPAVTIRVDGKERISSETGAKT